MPPENMRGTENLTYTDTTTGQSWTWNYEPQVTTAPYATHGSTTLTPYVTYTPYTTYSTGDMLEERIARLEGAIAKLEARLNEIEKLLKGDF